MDLIENVLFTFISDPLQSDWTEEDGPILPKTLNV